MKKLIYDSALLLLGCLLWTGCNNDEDLTVYSPCTIIPSMEKI